MDPEISDTDPLTLSVGDTVLEVRPQLGLVGSSLRVAGREFLRFHGAAAVRAGHTTGIPLLAPWANRLHGPGYRLNGSEVTVLGAPGVHVDDHGRPIHGTMVGRRGWEVDVPVVTAGSVRLRSRFDAAGSAEVMASFPFPHALTVEHLLEPARLTISTTVRATGSVAVPVSFGWHPYFALPQTGRDRWTVELPDRFRLEHDEGLIPTGVEQFEPAASIGLAGREFDDGYRLVSDRDLALTDGVDRIVVGFDDAYTHAQVYAPGASDLVAIEPMTAATDALSRGTTPLVEPGDHFCATFTITIC